VDKILQAAANAEVAAKMHWRSSYLAHVMGAINASTNPKVRREAIDTHAMEIEAVIKDLERGHFRTTAGAKIEV
jgi:hypothetical protein